MPPRSAYAAGLAAVAAAALAAACDSAAAAEHRRTDGARSATAATIYVHVPYGVRVTERGAPGGLNAITYDPDRASRAELEEFARDFCADGGARLVEAEAGLLTRLAGRRRAEIYC